MVGRRVRFVDSVDVLAEVMRWLLLWMARNRWLRERIPRLPPVKRAIRRFMPGEDQESALLQAELFRNEGIGCLFTQGTAMAAGASPEHPAAAADRH